MTSAPRRGEEGGGAVDVGALDPGVAFACAEQDGRSFDGVARRAILVRLADDRSRKGEHRAEAFGAAREDFDRETGALGETEQDHAFGRHAAGDGVENRLNVVHGFFESFAECGARFEVSTAVPLVIESLWCDDGDGGVQAVISSVRARMDSAVELRP